MLYFIGGCYNFRFKCYAFKVGVINLLMVLWLLVAVMFYKVIIMVASVCYGCSRLYTVPFIFLVPFCARKVIAGQSKPTFHVVS